MCVCVCVVCVPWRPVSQKQVGSCSSPVLWTQRIMRAGGNETPPDFDLTTSHQHIHMHELHTLISARMHTHRNTCHTLSLPPHWNRSLWMGCTDTVDGVWIWGSPLMASSITIFQRPAVLSYVHLSCSFPLLCMCSLTPLSVKSTVWLCFRQQLDGFKLLAWTVSGW